MVDSKVKFDKWGGVVKLRQGNVRLKFDKLRERTLERTFELPLESRTYRRMC